MKYVHPYIIISVHFYDSMYTPFLYSSYMKETEWINCCPQNLTKSKKSRYTTTMNRVSAISKTLMNDPSTLFYLST